jgi:hypothetical protein
MMAWIEVRSSGAGFTYHCRAIGCTAPAWANKSTGNFSRHLMKEHGIDSTTMTPLTHPEKLRGPLSSAVIAVMSVPVAGTAALLVDSSSVSLPLSSLSPSSESSSSSFRLPPSVLVSPSSSAALSALSASSPSSQLSSSSSSSSSLSLFAAPTLIHRPNATSQRTIHQSFQQANNPLVAPLAAKLWAKYGLPHRLADTKEMKDLLLAFRAATCSPPSKHVIRAAQTELATELRASVLAKLKSYSVSSPICIAIDGWTNTRSHKVTNVLCMCGGQAYYWCSIVNRYDKNTADWLLTPISTAINTLKDIGIRITALVADNEAVNGKLYRLLHPKFPFLLLSPCAAHTVQLCVNHSLKVNGIRDVMITMEQVIRQFRKGTQAKARRQQLAGLQRESGGEGSIKALVIPCDTRWSSHRSAGVRLLELQHFIRVCNLRKPAEDSFWPRLKELVDFLRPFQVATDQIQADNSTLYTVYRQFEALLRYVNQVRDSPLSPFAVAMDAVHNIIVENWESHVNKPAVLCCAWFSFDDGVRDYHSEDLTSARLFFISYAVRYARQYKIEPSFNDDSLRATIEELWGQFTIRAVSSPFAELDDLVQRSKAMQLNKNRRLVNGEWVSTWYPVNVWRALEAEAPLFAHPAIALLCIAGSEAAVERSFSAQDSVHSKKRNKLKDAHVQNEMFIRFNSDAVEGRRPESAVLGGNCVELTSDFDERPRRIQGSIRALFRSIAIAAAAAERVQSDEKEEKGESAPHHNDEEDSSSDSDYVIGSDSDNESSSESDDTTEADTEAEEEGKQETQSVSRTASIARQTDLSLFIQHLAADNAWTSETDWKNKELANIIEAAALNANVRISTKTLKSLIVDYVKHSL